MTQPLDDRLLVAIQKMVESYIDVRMRYYRPWAYQVKAVTPGPPVKMDLVSLSSEMPNLTQIVLWPGASGAWSTPAVGATVTVTFENGDSTQPRISGTDALNNPTTVTSKASISTSIFAPIVQVGDNLARPLAHATEVASDMSGISTLIAALSAYATAIKAIADPTNVATPVITAACTAAELVISTNSSTLPTTKIEGT